jgi:hypothetical protein
VVLEHVRRLDGVVVDAYQHHVFFVHGHSSRSPTCLSHSNAPRLRSLDAATPSAKITILKTIFS